MSWAIVEFPTLRVDGWYRDQAQAEEVAGYYAESQPTQRYLVVPFTPGNAAALGLSDTGRFPRERKIQVPA